jgi:hypothetical protein
VEDIDHLSDARRATLLAGWYLLSRIQLYKYYQKTVAGGRFNPLATSRIGLLLITCRKLSPCDRKFQCSSQQLSFENL